MKEKKVLLTAAFAIFLTSCASTDEIEQANSVSNIPSWVINPEVKDSFAVTECVNFSGNMSIDKRMATANARLALAQLIATKVDGLDKTYANRTDANQDITTGSTFSSVSKQLTSQKLTGSQVIKSEIIKIAGKDNLCVLTILPPKEKSELLSEIIKGSNRAINPADEKFLYQEFKAYKAEQSLDTAIKKATQG